MLYFLFMGTRWVKSVRYFLPIYPTLFLLAAWGLVFFWRWASVGKGAEEQRRSGDWEIGRLWRRPTVLVLVFVIVLPSLLWAVAFTEIYRQPLTRVAASDWIFENVPTALTLLYNDQSGEAKQLQLPVQAFPFEPEGVPLLVNLTMPESGVITGVRFNYLNDPGGNEADEGESLRVRLNDGSLAEATLELDEGFEAATIELPATPVAAEQPIQLVAEAGAGGPIHARTSLLMNEEWDDALPVNTQGRNAYGAYYTGAGGRLQPVNVPDSPDKLAQVTAWLDEADYVMISSQRAMWSLPRLPLTFPLMIHYYESLFNGELGFDLVAQFHGDIHVGPLHISDTGGRVAWGAPPEVGWPPPGDLAAEEAFSVYDHPPVWIFAKTDRYSSENTRRVLGSVDLSQVVIMNPLEATRARNGLMLTESKMETQKAGGTFSELFNADSLLNTRPVLAAVVWWLAVILLGWLTFPLTFIALGGLPERGYGLSRVLGMLLLSYVPWLLASLDILPHTRATLWLALLLIVAASMVILLRQWRKIVAFVGQNLVYVGVVELLAVVFYLLMIGIRLGNPDVWHVFWGGEKPMDLSYFTAVLKSTTFPPYDPWFSGGYLNYYYYGFVFVGALTKLLGVTPTIAYNLILPMLFSFTGIGVFSLAYNLVASRYQDEGQVASGKSPRSSVTPSRRAVIAGLIAAVLAILVGNLAQAGVIANIWQLAGSESLERIPLLGGTARTLDGGLKVLGGQPAPVSPSTWFWDASRAINYNPGEVAPITEFPFFTFLYGDLHAHMISMPLTLLALGWAISLALQRYPAPERTSWLGTGWQWLAGGLAIGSLRATNTWDWPAYLVVGALAIMFVVYRRYERVDLRTAGAAVLLVAAMFLLSVLTFWPYAAHYGTGYSSASLWPGSYTYLTNYLIIYGLFLFLAITYLAVEFRGWAATLTSAQLRRVEPVGRLILVAAVLYVVALVVMLFRNYWIAPLVVTLIAVAGLLGLQPSLTPARRIALILLACALGLTLVVEIFVLDGDIGRMNTVFKFYMQVWLLLSIVGGVAAVWGWQAIRQKRSLRRAWVAALSVLVLAAALYPLTATKAKWEIRMSEEAPTTLDGMAFMPYTVYGDADYAGNGITIQLGDDYEALRWLQRSVEGSPVVAEAHGTNPYQTISSRVAMYTGLPTIVGWDWHQRQQRAVTPGQLVSSRIEDVNLLFRTPNVEEARTILEHFDVEYIFVGSLERAYYHPDGLAKFEQMVSDGYLTIPYQDAHVTIYRVNQEASPQAIR
jgi:YYY domain-containing protein